MELRKFEKNTTINYLFPLSDGGLEYNNLFSLSFKVPSVHTWVDTDLILENTLDILIILYEWQCWEGVPKSKVSRLIQTFFAGVGGTVVRRNEAGL